MVCAIDANLLVEDAAHPIATIEEQPPVAPREKDDPTKVFPEYQWKAKDAWKCLAMVFMLRLVFTGITTGLRSHSFWFETWDRSGYGRFFVFLFTYGVYVVVAAYFARTETFALFLRGFGLNRKPTELVWLGILMALVIRIVGHSMMALKMGPGVSAYDFRGFKYTLGFERYFFLGCLILLAPLLEESLNRGFLYKAFRGSYPLVASIGLMIGWTCFTHWSYYYNSWVAALDLSALTIVQCYLREKSDSLWDTIICHFIYNASSLFISGTSS